MAGVGHRWQPHVVASTTRASLVSNRTQREHAFDAMYRDETNRSNRCRDCGVIFASRPWHRVRTVGHNIPLSRLRAGDPRDLVKYDQCAGCNADQGTRTPEEWAADRSSGRIEPIMELTDDQKRLRARATWERAEKRRRQAKHVTDRIDLDEVPDHLLSHLEVTELALEHAKHTIKRGPRELEERQGALDSARRSLGYQEARPEKRRYLFGLIRTIDQDRLRSIERARGGVADAEGRLDFTKQALTTAHGMLEYISVNGGVRNCSCGTCQSNFDVVQQEYKDRREEERIERWRHRPAARPSSYRGRRGW